MNSSALLAHSPRCVRDLLPRSPPSVKLNLRFRCILAAPTESATEPPSEPPVCWLVIYNNEVARSYF